MSDDQTPAEALPGWQPPAAKHYSCLQEIRHCEDKFVAALSDLGESGYVLAWTYAADRDVDRLAAAAERYYERIVNAFTELFDVAEKAQESLQMVPEIPGDRTRSKATAQKWWERARELGFDAAGADVDFAPGRWRRGAVYGLWAHDDADLLQGLLDSRRLFQHGYGARSKHRGAEVWDTMTTANELLRERVATLERWVDAPSE